MFGKPETCEVLVVGAGPVGLFAALQLAERGIKVRIVDQEKRTATHSYALVLHPETLRALFRSGPFRNVLKDGAGLRGMAFYDAAQRKAEVGFPEVDGALPFALVLPQSMLEKVLEDELARWDVHVEWNHRLTAISQDAEGVTAEVAKLDRAASGYPYARMEWIVAKTIPIRAKFLVGADGYSSFVRRALEISYREVGRAQSFSVYEFTCTGGGPSDEVRVALNDATTEVLWPLAPDRFRFSFQIEDATRHEATAAQLERFIRERAPWFQGEPQDIRWTTAVLFERRLAERFGVDRVWLAGDAAHITGPVGGQSMNVGLLEARDLSAAIAASLREGADLSKLESYGVARRDEWKRLLGTEGPLPTDKHTDPWVGSRADRILPCLPASGSDLERLMDQLGIAFTGAPRASM